MMKNILLAGTALATVIAAGDALAAGGPTQGKFGLNVALSKETIANQPVDFMLNGRYFFAKDMAVTAGVGLNFVDTGAANNSNYTAFGFKAGMRKYLKTEELSPFIGGNFEYVSTRDSTGTTDISGFDLTAEAGAEYFFAKQFSMEGAVSFGYSSLDLKPAGGGNTTTASGFGTEVLNLSANFYF